METKNKTLLINRRTIENEDGSWWYDDAAWDKISGEGSEWEGNQIRISSSDTSCLLNEITIISVDKRGIEFDIRKTYTNILPETWEADVEEAPKKIKNVLRTYFENELYLKEECFFYV